MSLKGRYNTSTKQPDNSVVPWLASEGPLAYSPEQPPDRDYFFQYSWIIPGIFAESENRRRHYYFGDYYKPEELFRFWETCRSNKASLVYLSHGVRDADNLTAPIAIYRHNIIYPADPAGYLFVQHGSYQEVESASQPEIKNGFLHLYRGIYNTSIYEHFSGHTENSLQAEIWQTYLDLQWQMLSDSVLSFMTIHDRAKRSETEHIKDRSWLSDELAIKAGLQIETDTWTKALWKSTHQSFALERWVAERKFGPNFVIFRSPITNVRLTTFFAGEKEVRVIDSRKLELVEAHGCGVREI